MRLFGNETLSTRLCRISRTYLSALAHLFRSIIPDLRHFPLPLTIFTIFFAAILIVFNIIDFEVLRNNTGQSVFKWVNDKEAGVATWRRALMLLSGVASFTGGVCVILCAMGLYTTYFWGIINTVTYGIFSIAYGYAGDTQLYLMFYMPTNLIGIYTWYKRVDDQDIAISRSLTWPQRGLVLVVSVGLGSAFYYEIPAFARAITGVYFFEGQLAPNICDATTNALSIIAQVLMMFRFWEQWVLWIIVDIIQVLMYSGAVGPELNVNIFLMWLLFLFNAFFGCWRWWKRAKMQEVKKADLESVGNKGEGVHSVETEKETEGAVVIGKGLT
ncbi:nicotinamide mononucleotide transporter PnuC [Ascobolus immersus RN42]|uniref:Nicotinamide mononucleotide transporter PnuC n=1 Tax=Ascobolus immersus RN42 TaxID=1160509 RepID=A0A3N4I155_ASCIM|nr:nicotinamide mononucleotide transporter PnuC [Ascobolus immersus RN42]